MGRRVDRIVFAGGGTGGHLYPALSVADELRARRPQAEIVFVGARRGLERRLVPRAGYPLLTLPLSGIQGTGRLRRISAILAAAWAVVRCIAWMVRKRPSLVIGVGGYASGPAVLAAWVLRIRTMVLEQNHYPGATNRWLAPRVDAVCLPSEAARRHIRGRLFVTGNPVRRSLFDIAESTAGDELSLLVFGGSRGARSINRAMVEALPQLAVSQRPVRIVHQTGRDDEDQVRAAYAGWPEERSHVAAFLDDMPERLEHADLVVCRAGASTLAELCAAGRPSILVPYPHAADDHQRRNAEAMVEAGAAVLVLDEALDRLAGEITTLAGDPARLAEMGRAARALARPDAAGQIVDLALALFDDRFEELPGVS